MKNQNLDGFKPLSEEEESHVIGGKSGQFDNCAPIAQQIAMLENELKSFPPPARNTPAYKNLEQQLAESELAYKRCEAQTK